MTYDYGTAAPAPEQQKVNKKATVFTGRISHDVTLNVTGNNNKVCNINFAIDQLDGNTMWGQAVFWGTDAQIASDFLSKGDTITGSGLMYMRAYTKNDGTMGEQLTFDFSTLLLPASKVQDLILRIVDAKLARLGTAPVQAVPAPVAQVQAAVVQPTQPQQQPQAQPVNTAPVPPQAQPQPEPVVSISDDSLPF